MRYLRKASAIIAISLVLLTMGSGTLRLSPLEMAAVPYRYDLLTWEVAHLPDKWLHKLKSFLPWNSQSRQEKLSELRKFFQIREEIQALERELATLGERPSQNREPTGSTAMLDRERELEGVQDEIKALRSERSAIKAGVEETLESEVSAVLAREGLSSRIGLIFPPVDVALTSPPKVLVVSPRHRIEREQTMLLKADMKVEDMEKLEEKIFRKLDRAALVVGIGGVATYPTIVKEDSSLRSAAVTAAHEWLHTYWFFKPMGWNIFSTPQMHTLNETAADLAGRELGQRAYESITGRKDKRTSISDLPLGEAALDARPQEGHDEKAFNFNLEMRKTRARVDELLAQGQVVAAEAYMEERRQLFVANGFFIRKLNQAFFAFNGTYAASPASVSPIGGQVEELRAATDSIGDFIRTMAGFGSYREFINYLSGPSDSGSLQGWPGHAAQTAYHGEP